MMRQLLMIFAVFPLFIAINLAQSVPIPYIHYYDYLRGGLVIERANGTDSRLIADLIPDGHNAALMPEWSASGKWFVSSTYQYDGQPTVNLLSTFIVNTDGQRKIDLGLSTSSHFKVSWSPVEDTLLIFTGEPTQTTIHMYLLEVETETVLAEQVTPQPDYWEDVSLHWAKDGMSAFVSSNPDIFILHTGGQVETYSYPISNPLRTDFHKGFLFYIAPQEEILIGTIEHLETGRKITFKADNESYNPKHRYRYHIHWNSSLTHALIFARLCGERSCTQSLKLVDEVMGSVWDVPLQIDNVALDECDYGANSQIYCNNPWSPDGDFVLMRDDKDILSLIDVATKDIQPIAPLDTLDMYRWSDDNLLLLFYQANLPLYLYAARQAKTIEIPFPEKTSRYRLTSSPQGTYLGLMSFPAQLINRDGQVIRQILPHSYSTGAASEPFSYQWHESEQWGMVEYTISFAGGGIGPMAAIIFETQGDLQRELPIGSQAGFLPNHAVPLLSIGQPYSAIQTPIYVIPQAGNYIGIGWHPTDPNRFVTYSEADDLIFWSLETGQPQITEKRDVSESYASPFPSGLYLSWLPNTDEIVTQPMSPPFDSQLEGVTNYAFNDAHSRVIFEGNIYSPFIAVLDKDNGLRIDQFYGTAYSLALSADGRWLATTSAGKVSIWDVSEYLP